MAGTKRFTQRIDTVLLRLLLLAGTPIVVIAIAMVLLFSFRTLPALFDEAETQLEVANYSSSITIATWLSEHRQRLRYVAATPAAIDGDLPTLLTEAIRMTETFTDFVAIVFADMNGNVLLDSNRGIGGGYVGDREYYLEARSGQSIIGNLIRGRTNEQYVVMIAEAVRGRYQSVIGVAFAPVRPDVLESVLQMSRSDPSMSVYIVDSQYYIVTGSGLGERLDPDSIPAVGHSTRYINYRDVDVLGHRTFVPGTRWTLVTERPFATVAQSIRRYNRLLVTTALVALAFSVIAAAIIAGTIQRPIHRLDDIARLVGSGQFSPARNVPFNRGAPLELMRLHRVLVDTVDQLEQRRREVERGKAILEATQEMARLGSWEYEPRRHRFVCSPEVFRIIGARPHPEGCGVDDVLTFVHPEDRRALKYGFFRSIREGVSDFEIDHRIVNPLDSSIRVVHQRCVHTFDPSGTLISTRGMIHDITERHAIEVSLRAALADKSVLLQEVHHRVRNNLAIVESLLTLKLSQLPEHTDAWEAIAQSRSRISSIAVVHDQLYQQENVSEIYMPDYVKQIVENVRESYGSPNIEVQIEIDPLHLEMTTCIPCGMILNELLVNSYRHAFPEKSGRILVRMVRDDTVTLTVADDGVGLQTGKPEGLGSEIVRQLVRQINGSLSVSGGQGTTVAVSFNP